MSFYDKVKYLHELMRTAARPTCYQCFRPKSSCYCAAIHTVNNRTRVIIVQHPREHFHPLNTARIAERSLRRCDLLSVAPPSLDKVLAGANLASDAALLFPDEQAQDLESISEEERPSEVIVVDGTWHHAKTLLRDVSALRRFRRLRFQPQAPSEYRIRKEPAAHYLSTIESIAHVLARLEPETPGIDRLLHAFHFMIQRNIALRASAEIGGRFVNRKKVRPHRFPGPLENVDRKRYWVVYAEGTSRWCDDGGGERGARLQKEPLVVYLQRAFAPHEPARRVLIRTTRRPSARLLSQLCISEDELDEAVAPSVAQQILQDTFPEDAVVAVCHASSYRILVEAGLCPRVHLELKGIYCDFQRYLSGRGRRHSSGPSHQGFLDEKGQPVPFGDLDDVLFRHGISVPTLRFPEHTGAERKPSWRARGTLRLAQSVALFAWIREQAELHLRSFS